MSKTTKIVLIVLAVLVSLGCLCSGGCLALGFFGEAPRGLGADSEGPGALAGGDEPPAPSISVEGQRTTWGGYSVVAPPGMAPAVGPDGLQLKQQGAGNGECTIVLLPMEAAAGKPDAQAFAIVSRYFQGTATSFLGKFTGPDPYAGQERGVSSRGFEWVELPELWPLGANGQRLDARVRVMLVLLGDKVAPIVGLETGEASCLMQGRASPHQWLRVFYSLGFPSVGLRPQPAASKAVVGAWSVATSSAAASTEYRADGTCLTAVGTRTTVEISNTQERETDHTWAGDCRWSVHGERLTVETKSRPAQTVWFRVVDEQNSSAQGGWITQLREFQVGADGLPYEGAMRREVR